jgi:hydroxypyruvate reductase
VTLRKHGKGGRNLELALGAVDALAGWENVALATLATDGDDGNSGAAGAIVTGNTHARAAAKGLKASEYLHEHNSFHFFAMMDDLIITKPTGTNVNDLNFLFIY